MKKLLPLLTFITGLIVGLGIRAYQLSACKRYMADEYRHVMNELKMDKLLEDLMSDRGADE